MCVSSSVSIRAKSVIDSGEAFSERALTFVDLIMLNSLSRRKTVRGVECMWSTSPAFDEHFCPGRGANQIQHLELAPSVVAGPLQSGSHHLQQAPRFSF